jgi:NADH-quinone oxidoreductase subunit N
MIPPLLPVLPLVVVAAAIVLGVIAVSIRRNHRFVFSLTIAAILAAFATLPVLARVVPRAAGALFLADSFALFYSGLILAAALAVVVLSHGYVEGRGDLEAKEEYYLLLMGALLGSLALIEATHFISFILGLEVLSVSLYALVGYYREEPAQTEGAVKYLILAGCSSAFLLFGMAVLYGVTGTMELGRLAAGIQAGGTDRLIVSSATVFLIVGIGFKLGVVPFHLWTPDVYESAPAPVTAFVATVSKGSMFALLLRLFGGTDLSGLPGLLTVFVIIAVTSMFVGNLLGLFQGNVKRLLAYSSISHFGYLLVPFCASGPIRITAVSYYLAAYFATVVGAFGVVTLLSGRDGEAGSIDHYQGLFRRRPWLAGSLTLMFLSLVGMPLTAGFIGKVYVVAAGTASMLWLPVISLVVGSAIGLFYYLRVIFAMFGEAATGVAEVSVSRAGGVLMALLVVLIVWWGVYPVHLIRVIEMIRIGQ